MNAVFVTQPLYSDPYKLLLWSTASKRNIEKRLLCSTTFMLGSKGFLATTIIADLISTAGECYGIILSVVIFIGGLFSIFGTYSGFLPMGGVANMGAIGVLLAPLVGFSIILGTRWFSEMIVCIAMIARNTTK